MLRYAVTNRAPDVGDGEQADFRSSGVTSLLDDVRRWTREGVEYVLLREKALERSVAQALASAVLSERNAAAAALPAPGSRTRVLVHTSAEVAVASGADGVHLPGSWSGKQGHPGSNGTRLRTELDRIRAVYAGAGMESPEISVSCHTVEEVRSASLAGVGLILFGPIFEKQVEEGVVLPGLGLETLQHACSAAGGVPVLALGGVTRENTAACLRVGAAGVGGIRLFHRTRAISWPEERASVSGS